MFLSHYWRRREPPVFLRIACFRSSLLKHVISLYRRKNATVKLFTSSYIPTLELSSKVYWFWLPCIKQYTFQKCIDLCEDRQTLYFTVANVRDDYKQYIFFTKLEKQSPHMSPTGGSRRRLQWDQNIRICYASSKAYWFLWWSPNSILPLQIFGGTKWRNKNGRIR